MVAFVSDTCFNSARKGAVNSTLIFSTLRPPGSFGYDKKLGTCSILEDEKGRSSKAALFIIAFLVPCLVIVLCYARIFYVVHQ
jgi:hypothetical protein